MESVLLPALLWGAVLCVELTVLTYAAGKIALDAFVDKYPLAIQQKFGPLSARAARLKPLFALVILVATFALPYGGLVFTSSLMPMTFWQALVFTTTVLLVFNVYDLLVLDWLFFCTIQPRSMVLPGTEGMAEYRDYGFHFIGFLKGLVFSGVGGLVVAGVWNLIHP